MCEHLAVIAEPRQRLEPDDLPVALEPLTVDGAGLRVPARMMDEPYRPAKDRVVSEFDRVYLTRLVDRARGNLAKAARLAGIDRTTLYRLLEKHELHRAGVSGAIGIGAEPART
jgi:DNA-binding NtrC family response regulator